MGFMICTPHQIITGVQIKMRWAGHVERMADMRVTSRVLGGRPEGKRPLGRDVKGRIILIWIFKKYDGAWSDQAQHGKRWCGLLRAR